MAALKKIEKRTNVISDWPIKAAKFFRICSLFKVSQYQKKPKDNAISADKIAGLARALRDAKEIYKVSAEVSAESVGRVG